MSKPVNSKAAALSALPSVDQLLRMEAALKLRGVVGAQRITAIAREVTKEMREEIQHQSTNGKKHSAALTREALLVEGLKRLEQACARESLSGLRRVINATGVILHTNLGRAPLSESARQAVTREAAGYCTLEYDTVSGSRGRRGARVEQFLIELTGAEDALVVNNCASAALLILTVLAADCETLVSRGELVEIGGDFRVPEVLANSRTRMVEVGTTNRTSLADYQQAINPNTCLIMRVHQSNYRIVGFTTAPARAELATLAHQAGLVFYEDAGSGLLMDLSAYGLADEPLIKDCLAAGADVVSFSGDKLLGASQAGLIVGTRAVIERLRKHPLYRALRVDKLCLAALEATLDSHRRSAALQEIPTLRMLALSKQELEERSRRLAEQLTSSSDSPLTVRVIEGESAIGGGSGPIARPLTVLIALEHESLSADEIERRLRIGSPPIIGRISHGKVLLDLRTVAPEEETELIQALSLLANERGDFSRQPLLS
jgi:L-seryl-tRNA(Ser) seleniumtransferase